ncbi:transcription-repair coupling factor [Desulforegula conservatrix]|uniref:transcription-repair coupling factor n=1 Tax=Desulforegula conservatrix TaxID=153026 RepID=UPI0006849DCC|nr:transcription-repair coupling factor [Desulforegula conservatrix]
MNTRIVDTIMSKNEALSVSGLNNSGKALLISELCKNQKRPVWIIVETQKDADRIASDISFFSPDTEVEFLPPYNILPLKNLSKGPDSSDSRISLFYRLMNNEFKGAIIITPEALIQKVIPVKSLSDNLDLLIKNESIDLDAFISGLMACGYERAAIVENPGDFCLRGGILDVFSPIYSEPLRLEFFGDVVDDIRFFSPETQKKTGTAHEVVIVPAKETIFRSKDADAIIGRIRKHAADCGLTAKQARETIDRLKNEGLYQGIETLLPFFHETLGSIFDYISEGSVFIVDEPRSIEKRARDFRELVHDNFEKSVSGGKIASEADQISLSWEDASGFIDRLKPLIFKDLEITDSQRVIKDLDVSYEDNSDLTTKLKNISGRENLFGPLADWINIRKEQGLCVLLLAATKSQAERLHEIVSTYGVNAHLMTGCPDFVRQQSMVYVCTGRLSKGFTWPDKGLAVAVEDEIFGLKYHRRRTRKPSSIRESFLALEELASGDLIVHSEHGIGMYQGLEKLSFGPVVNDFLLITYQGGDKLFIPVDRINTIQKYLGVEEHVPVLDKMGGKSWDKAKEKAKKEVEKIAGELLALYAARKAQEGYSFAPPDHFFRDFEASFPYDETPDQLKAIDDVLGDMGSSIPMDRLVCGDVGYGKTEVALRAAFKAVSDSKQAVILVPTTILAEQHFRSFKTRFERYPVRLACLNRFRTKKEQHEIVEGLKNGSIDIVVGTHRLLQKDIEFKDVGLIVIDEEQRFGVKHKERLKNLRKTVDVLALSATPIPRTLHMSMMGIRDISVIATPPEERVPIKSYLSDYDESIISKAVRFELARGGQIFFVHNNIGSLDAKVEEIKKIVPEVRIGTAHGKMSEEELEKSMIGFINRDFDMLVCTTIIESGLDIPSANTMIINKADRFGLSQIYQLKGRIGRGSEQAFAYLLLDEGATISKDAQKRLKVLMEYSDLGSGFHIAMSDLQIRGGGAALGVSQSGHIAAVGYDMFLQLLDEAVADMKGEPKTEALEPEINIVMSSFIPESYVPDLDQRLHIYRRLSRMTNLNEIGAFREEMTERYGKPPLEALNILLKIMIRILAIRCGIKRVDLSETTLVLQFSPIHLKKPFAPAEYAASKKGSCVFTSDNTLKIDLGEQNITQALAKARNVLKELSARVNN